MAKVIGMIILGLILTSGISYSDETKKIIKNCADRRSKALTVEMVKKDSAALAVLAVQYYEARTTAAIEIIVLKEQWMDSEDKLKIEKQMNKLEIEITKLEESYEKNMKLRAEESKKNWEIEYNQVLKHCKNEYEKSPETFKSRWKNKYNLYECAYRVLEG